MRIGLYFDVGQYRSKYDKVALNARESEEGGREGGRGGVGG